MKTDIVIPENANISAVVAHVSEEFIGRVSTSLIDRKGMQLQWLGTLGRRRARGAREVPVTRIDNL